MVFSSSTILFFSSSSPRQMGKLRIFGALLDACIWCAAELERILLVNMMTNVQSLLKAFEYTLSFPICKLMRQKILEDEHIVYHDHNTGLGGRETDIVRKVRNRVCTYHSISRNTSWIWLDDWPSWGKLSLCGISSILARSCWSVVNADNADIGPRYNLTLLFSITEIEVEFLTHYTYVILWNFNARIWVYCGARLTRLIMILGRS